MDFDDYKAVIYRNQPDGWVAEIPAIAGCHALRNTAEEAVSEVGGVSIDRRRIPRERQGSAAGYD